MRRDTLGFRGLATESLTGRQSVERGRTDQLAARQVPPLRLRQRDRRPSCLRASEPLVSERVGVQRGRSIATQPPPAPGFSGRPRTNGITNRTFAAAMNAIKDIADD